MAKRPAMQDQAQLDEGRKFFTKEGLTLKLARPNVARG